MSDEKPKMDLNEMSALAKTKWEAQSEIVLGAAAWRLLAAPLPQLAAHPATNKHS